MHAQRERVAIQGRCVAVVESVQQLFDAHGIGWRQAALAHHAADDGERGRVDVQREGAGVLLVDGRPTRIHDVSELVARRRDLRGQVTLGVDDTHAQHPLARAHVAVGRALRTRERAARTPGDADGGVRRRYLDHLDLQPRDRRAFEDTHGGPRPRGRRGRRKHQRRVRVRALAGLHGNRHDAVLGCHDARRASADQVRTTTFRHKLAQSVFLRTNPLRRLRCLLECLPEAVGDPRLRSIQGQSVVGQLDVGTLRLVAGRGFDQVRADGRAGLRGQRKRMYVGVGGQAVHAGHLDHAAVRGAWPSRAGVHGPPQRGRRERRGRSAMPGEAGGQWRGDGGRRLRRLEHGLVAQRLGHGTEQGAQGFDLAAKRVVAVELRFEGLALVAGQLVQHVGGQAGIVVRVHRTVLPMGVGASAASIQVRRVRSA